MSSHSTAASAAPLSRWRRITIWTLIVVATAVALLCTLTLWTERQILDNDGFEHASTRVIQDPEVRSAVSVYLVNQLYENVDVAQAIGDRLPPTLQPIAVPLA